MHTSINHAATPPPLQPWPRPCCTYMYWCVVLAYVVAYADTNIFCHYVEIPTTWKWLPPVQSSKYLREKHLNVTNTLPPAVQNSWMIQSGDFRPPYNINHLGYVVLYNEITDERATKAMLCIVNCTKWKAGSHEGWRNVGCFHPNQRAN